MNSHTLNHQKKTSTMLRAKLNQILTYSIAMVWIVNGLFCKVLNFVPRHEQIVAHILGAEYASFLTLTIGFSEITMAMWVLSGYKSKLNAIAQIIIVAVMNTLEFTLVPHLLLWGKLNAVFALVFIGIVYYNQFHLNNTSTKIN